MASSQQAIIAPRTAMIRLATCEPAVILPGETAIINAEVSGATEPPSAIEMRIRSSQREIIAEGSLLRTMEVEPFRYSASWSPSAELAPGAYDILLRLPSAERGKLITVTLVPSAPGANLSHLQHALRLRMQSRLKLEAGDETEAVALLEGTIAAYESASQPSAAAEAMLDAANLYTNLFQQQKAMALFQRVLKIREATADQAGAEHCRRKLASLAAKGAGAD